MESKTTKYDRDVEKICEIVREILQINKMSKGIEIYVTMRVDEIPNVSYKVDGMGVI